MRQLYKKLVDGVPEGHLIIESNLLQLHPEIPVTGTGYILPSAVTPFGYCKFQLTPQPQNENLLKTFEEDEPEENSDGIFVQTWKLVDKVLDTPEDRTEAVLQNNTAKQSKKLQELSTTFTKVAERPRVFVESLDFYVDGSYNDLQNFQIGKDLGLTSIKDADNIIHNDINPKTDYDAVISAIKIKGAQIIQTRWQLDAQIKAIDLTTEDASAELDQIDVKAAFELAS